MRIAKTFLLTVSLVVFGSFSIRAAETAETLAEKAVSGSAEESRAAVAALREMRQAGLDALFEKYGEQIDRFIKTGEKTSEWARISAAIDAVAMQKDAYASRLFWLTDLDEAKRLSKETGKPILSLRLLGNLNEEFSCANSRFFRAVLYSNKDISDVLRERYVLHWQSVRPAPRITIDFGDGRKIERTITGNSVHYVLDETGTVINALPGLYTPKQFLTFLRTSESWLVQAKQFESDDSWSSLKKAEKRRVFLKNMREREFSALRQYVNSRTLPLKIKFDKKSAPRRQFEEMPTAVQVAPLAIAKMATEVMFLDDVLPDITRYGAEQIDFESWKKIAEISLKNSKLDASSLSFIRNQTGRENLSEAQFASLVARLEELLAIDSARNDFLLRPTLLVWLNKDLDRDVDALNKKVYDELFLTPNEDPWLGLYAPDVYTALDGGGIKR
jgi:hypothetical protein